MLSLFGTGLAKVILVKLLNHLVLLKTVLSRIVSILSPFIWGLVISYLLYPFVKILHHKVFRPITKKLFKKLIYMVA